MKARLRWDTGAEHHAPRHPYRDSAILYAVLAGVLVLVTALTDGQLMPGDTGKNGVLGLVGRIGAIPLAIGLFVLATGFSWWRWRVRLRDKEESR